MKIAFSKDARQLATMAGFAEVKAWDLNNRECVQTFTFNRIVYRSVHGGFLPNGDLLVAAQREPIAKGWELWKGDVKTGAKQRVRAADNEFAFALWPEQDTLAVYCDDPVNAEAPRAIKLIDLAGKKKDRVVRSDVPYHVLAFARDKSLVVLEVGPPKELGVVRIVETATGKVVSAFPIHLGGCRSCLLLSDNKTLATLANDFDVHDRIFFWDVAKGEERYSHKCPTRVQSLPDLSSDGRLMAVLLLDGSVLVFDHEARRLSAPFINRSSRFYSLQFAPDGTSFATGEENGTVRLFDVPVLK